MIDEPIILIDIRTTDLTLRQAMDYIRKYQDEHPGMKVWLPVSDYACFCDKTNRHLIQLIKDLNPKYYFIENPRGGMRKMSFMEGLPRYTITYCQYGAKYMKPTDIWTNHPNPRFKPMCHNGDLCHEAVPRGSETGIKGLRGSKERSVIPPLLCEHIVSICENP